MRTQYAFLMSQYCLMLNIYLQAVSNWGLWDKNLNTEQIITPSPELELR